MSAPLDVSPRPGPILVGGTGRSGTTIAGRMLGARSDLALVPIELRFQCDRGGLADLATRRVGFWAFRRKLRRLWFERPPNASGPRGVHVVCDRETVETALERLRSDLDDAPYVACGQFLDDVVRPWTVRHAAQDWVEMTPPNGLAFEALSMMLPDARLIHMLRDGRDVAASVARRSWGPDDVDTALDWWADRVLAITQQIEHCEPGRVLTVRLESLVGDRREETYVQLEEFLGRGVDPGMREFFDSEVTQAGARPGSWARGLEPDVRRHVERRYEDHLRTLSTHGVDVAAHDGDLS